jgi:hypothetical protein
MSAAATPTTTEGTINGSRRRKGVAVDASVLTATP